MDHEDDCEIVHEFSLVDLNNGTDGLLEIRVRVTA